MVLSLRPLPTTPVTRGPAETPRRPTVAVVLDTDGRLDDMAWLDTLPADTRIVLIHPRLMEPALPPTDCGMGAVVLLTYAELREHQACVESAVRANLSSVSDRLGASKHVHRTVTAPFTASLFARRQLRRSARAVVDAARSAGASTILVPDHADRHRSQALADEIRSRLERDPLPSPPISDPSP